MNRTVKHQSWNSAWVLCVFHLSQTEQNQRFTEACDWVKGHKLKRIKIRQIRVILGSLFPFVWLMIAIWSWCSCCLFIIHQDADSVTWLTFSHSIFHLILKGILSPSCDLISLINSQQQNVKTKVMYTAVVWWRTGPVSLVK